MTHYFGSCVKSTVSLDSDVCEKEGCLQLRRKLLSGHSPSGEDQSIQERNELLLEIDRQNRKLIIIQKSKELLTEELKLSKEELESQAKRIKKYQQFRQVQQSLQYSPDESQYTPSNSIILSQKEEQIDLIAQQLKAKDKELSQLTFINQQLQDEIQSQASIIKTMQQSNSVQFSFYRKERQELEQELTEKKRQMIKKHQKYEDNLGEQEDKYLVEIENFNRKMMEFEQEIKELKKAGQKIGKVNARLKILNIEAEEDLKGERETVKWLNQLIEEAKIQYIHSELKKQESRDKTVKEKAKKGYKQYLNSESRSFRSVSEASTSLHSAKTIPRIATATLIAPFELSPINKAGLLMEWPPTETSYLNES